MVVKERKEKVVNIKQLSKLRLGRESLEKWINEKDFEQIIQGCFVRVLLGEKEGKRVYRIAVIQGVEASDAVYKVGDSLTTKLLVLNWGNAHKTFKMDFISNGDFTAAEYAEWQEQMQKCNLPPVTTKDVDRKIKHIKSFVANKRQQGQATDAPTLAVPTDTAKKPAPIIEVKEDPNPPLKRQKLEELTVSPPPEPRPPSPSPAEQYATALEAARQFYSAVKTHFDEQSEYLLELEGSHQQYLDFLSGTQRRVDQLAGQLEKKRREAGETLDDVTALERDTEKELQETQQKYEEELETMRREVRRRDKLLQERENDIADIQKQLQKAKTLAESERASLHDHFTRKESQLKEAQKNHSEVHEKLHQAHMTVQDQQQVINLQDHTWQELETQLRSEHAQAVATQQKRRKQALVLSQRLADYHRLKDEETEVQELIKQLIDPDYCPKLPSRQKPEVSDPAADGEGHEPESSPQELDEQEDPPAALDGDRSPEPSDRRSHSPPAEDPDTAQFDDAAPEESTEGPNPNPEAGAETTAPDTEAAELDVHQHQDAPSGSQPTCPDPPLDDPVPDPTSTVAEPPEAELVQSPPHRDPSPPPAEAIPAPCAEDAEDGRAASSDPE